MKRFLRISPLTVVLAATLIAGIAIAATKGIRASGGIIYRDGETNVYVTAYGAKGDGTTDDTTAIQNAINAATGEGRTVYFPAGEYKVTSTLQVSTQGLRFLGWREGRPGTASANEGATRLDYTGTGPLIQLGTQNENGDTGHANDAADYNGVQGFSLENIALAYTGVTTTALNNGQGNYGTGTYGVQDWRGGDVHFTNVRIENFQYGFWGIQSDINYFEKVEFNYNSVGIYAGPRSDQFTIDRLYGFYNDTIIWVDAARGTRVRDGQFVGNGFQDTAYPIKIGSAWSLPAQGVVFDNCWFEQQETTNWVGAYVAIGDGDTQTSTDIFFNDSTFMNGIQGSPPYVKYFLKIDHADNVAVVGVNTSSFNNFLKPFRFTGTGGAEVLFDVTNGQTYSGIQYQNDGSGTPSVNGRYWSRTNTVIDTPGTLTESINGVGEWTWTGGGDYVPSSDNAHQIGSNAVRVSNEFIANLLPRGADSTSGVTLNNSGLITLRGTYWNGSASVQNDAVIKEVMDSTTPTSHIGFTVGGSERVQITSAGNIAMTTGGSSISAPHFIGSGSAPAIAVGAGGQLGTSPSAAIVTAGDTVGTFNIVTGTTPSAFVAGTEVLMATITNSNAYASNPKGIIVEPANDKAGAAYTGTNAIHCYAKQASIATTTWPLYCVSSGTPTLAASTTYAFSYHVIQ